MNRTAQVVLILLLAGVAAMGALLLARGGNDSPERSQVVVYAPCGMASPITSVAHLFRQTNPEIELQVILDNSIVLVRNVRNGADPDIFISPGELEMKQLVDEGYVDPETVRDFGSLEMVVIAPKRNQELRDIEGLTGDSVKMISIADPEHNSVGYYGRAALESLGLWEPLQVKLYPREYPLEAVTMVTDGTADAGIAYLSCPLDTAPDKADKSEVRIVAKIPSDAYPPVRLQAGLLRGSRAPAEAQQFVDFMTSEQAQATLTAEGILSIGEGR